MNARIRSLQPLQPLFALVLGVPPLGGCPDDSAAAVDTRVSDPEADTAGDTGEAETDVAAPEETAADETLIDPDGALDASDVPEVTDPCAGRACGTFDGQDCGYCEGQKACSADGACIGWRTIDSYGGDLCGVLASGAIACVETWNDHRFPTGNDFTSVAVGRGFLCGLSASGTIACSGKDPSKPNQSFATDFGPAGTTWVQVAAGDHHYCARDAASHIQCWGVEAFDEISAAPKTGIFVDAGHERTCVIDAAHRATCVGRSEFGDLSVPAYSWETIVAANFRHACGTRRGNGEAVCWGDSADEVPAEAFVQIVLGPSDGTTCGLTSGGDVRCWGTGFGGRSIDGDFVAIALDQGLICALDGTGALECRSADGF